MKYRGLYISTLFMLAFLPGMEAMAYSIAAFGDSITRGYPYYIYDANGIANNGGYVPPLQSQLNNANWGSGQSVTVYNWGHPGEYIFYEGRYRISSILASNPDHVLVMEGTNDLAIGIGSGAVYDKLVSTINDVYDAGATPVVGTLLPRYDAYAWANSGISSLNSNLRDFATQNNYALADLQYAQPGGHSWSEYLPDGLHPNLTGYGFMADEWFAALQTITPNETPVANAGADQVISGSIASLDGSGSWDSDGSIQSYAWNWTGGSAEGISPAVTLPLGTTVITLTVTDNGGATDTDNVSITVKPVVTPMLYLLLLSD